MSRQLEQSLTAWMRRQATRASNPEGLALGAIRRARRIRRRRSITSATVAVIVLISAVPTGAAALDWFRGSTDPGLTATTGPDPTPGDQGRQEKPDGPARVSLDFGELPAGDTEVAWWDAESGTVHEDGQTLPMVQPHSFAPVAEGLGYALMTTLPDGGRRLEVVGPNGARPLAEVTPEYELRVPVVSADGGLLAWSENSSDDDGDTLHVATAMGEEVAETHLAGLHGVSVAGFSGDRVIFTSGTADSVGVWHPTSDQVSELPGRPDAVRAWATDPSGGLVAVATRVVKDDHVLSYWCNAVLDTTSAEVLWESCDRTPIGFSPDGRYAVTQPSDTEGAGPSSYTVVNARTGEPVLELRSGLMARFVWEDDSRHLVLETFVDDEVALVRCDLDGNCALITDPVEATFPPIDPPYVLSTR